MTGWKSRIVSRPAFLFSWSFECHLETESCAVKGSYLIKGSYQWCCNLTVISLCLFMAWFIIALINLSSLGHGFHSQSLTEQTSKDHLDFGEENNSHGSAGQDGTIQTGIFCKWVYARKNVCLISSTSKWTQNSQLWLSKHKSQWLFSVEESTETGWECFTLGYFYHQSS